MNERSLERIYRAHLGKAKCDWHKIRLPSDHDSDWKSSQHFIIIIIILSKMKCSFFPALIFLLVCFVQFFECESWSPPKLTPFGYMKFRIVVFILSSQLQSHCSTDWILSAGRNLTTEEQLNVFLNVRMGPSAGVLSFSHFIISSVHFPHAAACHQFKTFRHDKWK